MARVTRSARLCVQIMAEIVGMNGLAVIGVSYVQYLMIDDFRYGGMIMSMNIRCDPRIVSYVASPSSTKLKMYDENPGSSPRNNTGSEVLKSARAHHSRI